MIHVFAAAAKNIKNVTGDKMSKEPYPSLKQLMGASSDSEDESITLGAERMPKYITKKPKFSCPISPHIMWHHGLTYKECPLASDQRDMGSCDRCHLKGDSTAKSKKKRKKPYKKNKAKVEKRKKEPIPKVGKTYVSK
jgi:hypothetical protein